MSRDERRKDDVDDRHYHDWEAGDKWGVVIGVSKCRKCGKVSTADDFPLIAKQEQS
jgi:hypothetical protein